MGHGIGKIVIIVGAMVWASGCASVTAPQVRSAGDISVVIPFNGAADVAVEVTIDGDDMESPIVAELEIQDGMAQGLVDEVESGINRQLVVTAYDGSGELCSSSTTVDVVADLVTPVRDLSLDCSGPATETASRDEATTLASFGLSIR